MARIIDFYSESRPANSSYFRVDYASISTCRGLRDLRPGFYDADIVERVPSGFFAYGIISIPASVDRILFSKSEDLRLFFFSSTTRHC